MSGNGIPSGVAVSLPGTRGTWSFARVFELSGDQAVIGALLLTTPVKLLVAALFPLLGDEAYFVLWGKHLDYGYYDHGAMTGWWLASVLWMGTSSLVVRLPAVLASAAVGVLIWRALRPIDREKAGWVAAVYLWSPHSMVNIFMTTDTPLLFFSAVSGVFAYRACRNDKWWEYLLAGVFLGLAFLSKYFAVMLGLAYGVAFLFCVGRPRVLGLVLTFIGVLPAAAVNVLWNYNHGWSNIVFNLYTRQKTTGIELLEPLAFLLTTLVLLGPLAWYMLKPGFAERYPFSEARANWKQTGLSVFLVAFLVPQVILLLVSFTNRIGIHWPMSFYPLLFASLLGWFGLWGLKRMAFVMGVVSCTAAGGMMLISVIPVELAKDYSSYTSVILGTHPQEVLAKVQQLNPDAIIATPSYSKSATLNLYSDAYVPVIGSGSFHGRQDDLLTDLRELERRDILLITHKMEHAEESLSWFRAASVREVEVRSAKYFIVDGRGFRYPIYHRQVLRPVARQYYKVPDWLASWSPVSPFLVKYDLLPARSAE